METSTSKTDEEISIDVNLGSTANYYQVQDQVCPTCGRCQTCGKKDTPWYPYWPFVTWTTTNASMNNGCFAY